MKTNEFIKQVEALGFTLEVTADTIGIFDSSEGVTMMTVDTDSLYAMDTKYSGMRFLKDEVGAELFSLAVEYTTTPLDERDDIEYVVYCKRAEFFVSNINIGLNEDKSMVKTPHVDEAVRFSKKKMAEKVAELVTVSNKCGDLYEAIDASEMYTYTYKV